MEIPLLDRIKEKLFAGWQQMMKSSGEDDAAEMGKERIVVFIVALILALCLWLMVNLSREYNLNIDLPIAVGAVPEGQALSTDLPEHATVSVSGEGWKLISLYNNPPRLNINVSQSEVSLYDQVQQQMNMLPNISVQKVQPNNLNIQMEERETRKVPVELRLNLSFEDQYGMVSNPSIRPDSITISGARSLVNGIKEWPTDSVLVEDISSDVDRDIPLRTPTSLISLSSQTVQLTAEVAQFTEGEENVRITAQNMPEGQSVSFSPNSITVKYNVPIGEYGEVQRLDAFRAYINYSQIEQDSTGFLTPNIEKIAGEKYHIKVRTFQPRRVAYFRILGNN